jgi:hypothetical protein
VGHFIQLLAKAAARGGNLLMNVGPMGDGRIDPKDVSILQGIGAWWSINGESIRGTTRTPLPVQAWGESTRKGNTLFLHVFQWPKDRALVIGGLKSRVKSARIVGTTASPALTVQRLNDKDIKILGLPVLAPHAADSVIALECDGVEADPVRLLQTTVAADTLRVFDGELKGKGLKFGAGKTRDAYVYEWTQADQFVSWPVRLSAPAAFDVEILYDAEPGSAGGTFRVSVGSQTLTGTVQPGVQQVARLGRVSAGAGEFEIKLSAVEIKGGELMKPRQLVLSAHP